MPPNPPDPSAVTPPDNAGESTIQRYVYQAEVAFPYALQCAMDGDVKRLLLEHIEDVVIEWKSGAWEFNQVKTRDPGYTPWSLSDLLGKAGALRALHRTHKALESYDNVTYGAWLEGVAYQNDKKIQALRTNEGRISSPVLNAVASRLKITVTEARTFMERVRLRDGQVARTQIRNSNLILAASAARGHTPAELRNLVSAFEQVMIDSMSARLTTDAWWRNVRDPATADTTAQTQIAAKLLDKMKFGACIADIDLTPSDLLQHLTEKDISGMTLLDRKLRAGSATEPIIQEAKKLRALATRHMLLHTGGEPERDTDLATLHFNLKSHSIGIREAHADAARPAINVWNAVYERITSNPPVFDPNRVLKRKPALIMGEYCGLADKCEVDFGIKP